MIHPKYFENDADHVLHLFENYSYFKPLKAVVQLSPGQSETVNTYFEFIMKEERANNDYKKQALLLHLQMILIEAQRIMATKKVCLVTGASKGLGLSLVKKI